MPIIIAILIVACAACFFDLRTRRIPNALTFGAAIAALLFHLASSGAGGLTMAGAGWLVGAAMFFPFFALGGMGAGDVKLVAALGAWLGPFDAFWLVIYTFAAGGVIAVALALATGYLGRAVLNVLAILRYWATVGLRPHPELTLQRSTGPRLAYAVPVLAGVMVTLWLR
jgi:prepilin peptidase CpaA